MPWQHPPVAVFWPSAFSTTAVPLTSWKMPLQMRQRWRHFFNNWATGHVAPMWHEWCFFFLRHTPRGSRCWLNNLWGQQTVWWSPFVWCTVRCNRYLLCEDKNTSVLVSYSYHHVFAQPLVFSPRCRTQLSCHLCNIQEVRDALQKFGQLVREDSRWKNQLGACFIKLFDMDEE